MVTARGRAGKGVLEEFASHPTAGGLKVQGDPAPGDESPITRGLPEPAIPADRGAPVAPTTKLSKACPVSRGREHFRCKPGWPVVPTARRHFP